MTWLRTTMALWVFAPAITLAQAPCPEPSPVPESERVEVVPAGRYAGTAESGGGRAELELRADGTFVLTWQDPTRMEQGQWSGRYAWVRSGIGEALSLVHVQEALNGRRMRECGTRSLAVLRIDRRARQFALSLSSLGTVTFRPAR